MATLKGKSSLRIGGASGYWGDAALATPQLLSAGDLDVIVYDYLAEITMSIMARARAKDVNQGYAADFVTATLRQNLSQFAQQGVKIISNAGGVNPQGCADAIRALIKETGLDLKVAVITGDDLMDRAASFADQDVKEMFTGASFPDASSVSSINAYLGAFPIAAALDAGADIIITGRCVDSAVTLGACIHAFNWDKDDFDLLAAGSLVGHLIECGPQVTGGNFTDWESVGNIANIGYPIAEVLPDGTCTISKPGETSGRVSIGTVAEQMLYEIGDPQIYMLPDVACDFSNVTLAETGPDNVKVEGAKGHPPSHTYKVCATYADGFRAGIMTTFYGFDAEKKARTFAEAALSRARAVFREFNAGDFTETSIEILGADSQFGDFRQVSDPREVVMKLGVKHPTAMGAGLLLKEVAGLGLATPPGLSIFSSGRPKPSPVMRLYSFLTPKDDIEIRIDLDGNHVPFHPPETASASLAITRPAEPDLPSDTQVSVPLIKLAWARSGDKGDKANVGVIARDPDYLPYIWSALSCDAIAARLAHFIEGDDKVAAVDRFFLPGTNSMNFLIDRVLGGGGVASLRNDPQGKGYGQIILATDIPVSKAIAERLS
ncbi:MAG: acyclic terpene utilization AtuA family protein [Pseudomonadota bacterium]